MHGKDQIQSRGKHSIVIMGEKQKTNIVLYTAPSPNGYKMSITLDELGLSYEVVNVNIPGRQHKEPEFLAINPNGRIPALTDTLEDGTQIKLFESGSIQQYLVDRYDPDHNISYPRGTKEFYDTASWVRSRSPLKPCCQMTCR